VSGRGERGGAGGGEDLSRCRSRFEVSHPFARKKGEWMGHQHVAALIPCKLQKTQWAGWAHWARCTHPLAQIGTNSSSAPSASIDQPVTAGNPGVILMSMKRCAWITTIPCIYLSRRISAAEQHANSVPNVCSVAAITLSSLREHKCGR
jgi:hypothetical protein